MHCRSGGLIEINTAMAYGFFKGLLVSDSASGSSRGRSGLGFTTVVNKCLMNSLHRFCQCLHSCFADLI
jgi:hypothetical protein